MEVTPGAVLVFGEVPADLVPLDLGLLPSFDREQLAQAMVALGNASTIVGNLANARGLYRLAPESQKVLKAGGEFLCEGDQVVGAIRKGRKCTAQARFLPASKSFATSLAAIGSAIAMIGLQLQLGEISSLARINIALSTQTLKVIRHEQWAELAGLAEAVGEALQEARELGAVTELVWEPIAPSGPGIRKQLQLYRRNMADHRAELSRLDEADRRQYLETNAEAIVFDAFALLRALQTYAEYQSLRAALARSRSVDDEKEGQLFELLIQKTPAEIEQFLTDICSLTWDLTRELRIIAELPGRATVPLTKKRADAKAARLACAQLLETIGPLADRLRPPVPMPRVPETVCAPTGLDLRPYLKLLRWYLQEGETLRTVAFPYEVGTQNLAGFVPALLAKRVDATWEALVRKMTSVVSEKLASSTFVAITDRRILTATPRGLLRFGKLSSTQALTDVKFVCPRDNGERATLDVTTNKQDIHWMFPASAAVEQVDALTALLSASVGREAIAAAELQPPAPSAAIDH
ncbi:hypothetical protein [Buchananella hordeovulneris]|uniref:hypothetical protein n=1 Tax=Buchananella hordeovulneris TaxID=52770 RepID=UPI0026DAB714|nr:hypothetical protein [Buchananella hordeovulneris]MDO5081121.1 hypothetical protein [Buchananella hordeovulneris]